MKIFVTGRKGQLARSLQERAAFRSDIDLVAVSRPEVDLAIPGSVADAIRLAKPDVVINAAAYTNVDQAEDKPELAFRRNADAAGEVASTARDVGAPIIQISTDYVFDGQVQGALREDTPVNPLNVYGCSKLAGEELVRASNPDHLIVRTAWLYSPFGKNFVKSMVEAARERDVVTVVDDQWGSPTSALDLAEGLLTLIDHWRGGAHKGLGEIYHLAGSGTASWYELARHVMAQCRTLGLPWVEVGPIKTEDWPVKAARPRNSVLDSGKFARDFGFSMPDWRGSVDRVMARLGEVNANG